MEFENPTTKEQKQAAHLQLMTHRWQEVATQILAMSDCGNNDMFTLTYNKHIDGASITSIDHCLNLVIGSICEVWESPAGVRQNFTVGMMDKQCKRWQALTHSLKRRRRVLVAAQVWQCPRHVAKKRHRRFGVDVAQQRFQAATTQHVVTQVRSITCLNINKWVTPLVITCLHAATTLTFMTTLLFTTRAVWIIWTLAMNSRHNGNATFIP